MVGETRAGAYGACSSVVLLVVFVGEGEESRTWPEKAFQKAAESRRDLQEKEHQRALVPATRRDGESLQAWMKRDPPKWRQEKAKKARRRPGAHGMGLPPLPGRAVLLSSLVFPERA